MVKKAVYGLTGNMGCGKSEVAKILKGFADVVVFDADTIAKEILCASGNAPKIRALLGPQVFSDEKVDTRQVAQLVFNDGEALQRLEGFLHPLTRQVINEKVAENNSASLFFVEAALIYEGGLPDSFDGVVVVTCSEEEQYHRLRTYRGFTDEEITKRLKRQWPAAAKVERADYVIDTACSLPELKDKVQKLYEYLKGGTGHEKNSALPRHF